MIYSATFHLEPVISNNIYFRLDLGDSRPLLNWPLMLQYRGGEGQMEQKS